MILIAEATAQSDKNNDIQPITKKAALHSEAFFNTLKTKLINHKP